MSEALDVFATFAFVIRAMIVRSGKWAGLVFLLIGTIAGSCLTLSVDLGGDFSSASFISFGIERACVPRLATKSSAPDDSNTHCRGPLIKRPHDEFYDPSVFALA